MEKVKFNIQTPCNKDWSKFTLSEQGRFCHFCTQEVIDFTTKPEQEIFDFFLNQQYKNKRCVRMTDEQLKKGFRLNTAFVYFPKIIKRLATIVLIGFSITGMPVLLSGQTTVQGVVTDSITPKATDKVIVIEVPETYQAYEVQKLKTPEKVIVHKVPAEYKEIKMQKLIRKGGFVEWREIECIAPESEITIEIKVLKEKLAAKGYFNGTVDNIVTEELKTALITFKQNNKLIPAFELDKDTMYLLGLEN